MDNVCPLVILEYLGQLIKASAMTAFLTPPSRIAATARALMDADVQVRLTRKVEQESPNILDLILGHEIDLVIDTPSQGVEHSHDGFVIRRHAIETGVNVLTAIDTAKALVTSLEDTDHKNLTLIDIAKL